MTASRVDGTFGPAIRAGYAFVELGSWLAGLFLAAPIFLAAVHGSALDDRLAGAWRPIVWVAITVVCAVAHARLVSVRAWAWRMRRRARRATARAGLT